MKKNDSYLAILHQTRTADAVETLGITASFVREGYAFLAVGPAFLNAHDSLGIQLKWDRATNHGWVTPAEAEAITAHMHANLTK